MLTNIRETRGPRKGGFLFAILFDWLEVRVILGLRGWMFTRSS